MDIRTAVVSAVEHRATLAAARRALTELAGVLWQVLGAELADLVGELDALAALARGAQVAVTVQARTRGEIADSQASSTAGWVAQAAPALSAAGGASALATVVEAESRRVMSPVIEAVVTGRLAPPAAVAVMREFERLRPALRPEAAPSVLAGMVSVGATHGTRAVRELRARLVAEHGIPGQFQRDQDAAAAAVSLSGPVGDELGLFTYHLITDAEGKAVLEAAIGPLSAPAPNPDSGLDPRRAGTRRAQALIEVCRRATAAGTTPPVGVKTTLMVTMPMADLVSGLTGAGVAVGSSETGTRLAPDTIRRLACDAGVLPVVLGSAAQVLDLGRATRLFTPGQVKALWLRDRHCTFPGCSIPAHWCDAHHLTHWIDGGPSDLANAALLCGRHHTIAHRDRHAATVTPSGVQWNTRPGSYDTGQAGAGRPPHWHSHATPDSAA
jgi:hypothetical protein